MTPDVFLSYNREDQATARRFAEAFEVEGFSVWWDAALRSGEAYDQVTEEALRTAKAVVVLWSKQSVVSRWVRAEATLADRNRTLVPARIEACDLPIMFELTQTADLSHWQGDTRDPAWLGFLTDVRRLIDAGAARENQAPRAQPASKPPRRGGRPSLAILPFINRSELREDDVFANGMVDDLIAALSLSRRMKVVAASATAIYRKEARDLRRIGRELGVRYLLEGNVRRLGDDLRVTAQLIEAETDNVLWTQKFDRPLAELAALQEDLVTEVAAHLGVEVQRAEVEHALRKPGDITAWEALLRSDANQFRNTLAGYEAGVAEARRAIAIDPGYGAAYAVLAGALGQLHRYLGFNTPEREADILDNIRRALASDSTNPLVMCRIAGAYRGLGRPQDALTFSERAIALNPNLEILHITRASSLLDFGRLDEALAELDIADRLAPNSPWYPGNLNTRSVVHLRSGRPELALEFADRSARLRADPQAQLQRMMCLVKLERRDEARAAMRHLRDTNPGMSGAVIESLLRDHYRGSDDTDAFVALGQLLWDETSA